MSKSQDLKQKKLCSEPIHASDLLAEEGVERFRITDIAKQCDISRYKLDTNANKLGMKRSKGCLYATREEMDRLINLSEDEPEEDFGNKVCSKKVGAHKYCAAINRINNEVFYDVYRNGMFVKRISAEEIMNEGLVRVEFGIYLAFLKEHEVLHLFNYNEEE
jgi:hypothetical protein